MFSFHAPLEPHADPLITPLHTTAPWYFLWLQGMLKIGDKFLWGIIVPGILTGVLIAMPYVEVGPSRRYGDRRVGLTAGLLAVAAVAILSFMGTPWYAVSSSPDQEVVAELLPQTHPGPLREADFNALPAGTYEAANYASAPTPSLEHLLEEYNKALIRAADNPNCRQKGNCLVDGHGYMIIQDWQTDESGNPTLKRITFRVIWNGGPPGSMPGRGSRMSSARWPTTTPRPTTGRSPRRDSHDLARHRRHTQPDRHHDRDWATWPLPSKTGWRTSPPPTPARQVETGAALFENNCQTCHGLDGKGTGRAPALNSPDLLTNGKRLAEISWSGTVRDYIHSTIAGGRPRPRCSSSSTRSACPPGAKIWRPAARRPDPVDHGLHDGLGAAVCQRHPGADRGSCRWAPTSPSSCRPAIPPRARRW